MFLFTPHAPQRGDIAGSGAISGGAIEHLIFLFVLTLSMRVQGDGYRLSISLKLFSHSENTAGVGQPATSRLF